MKKIVFSLVTLLVLSTGILFLAFNLGNASPAPLPVHICVYDSGGNPVVGAYVMITGPETYYAYTAGDGCASFNPVTGTYCVCATYGAATGNTSFKYQGGSYFGSVQISDPGPSCPCTNN